jgi:hypothetical protein
LKNKKGNKKEKRGENISPKAFVKQQKTTILSVLLHGLFSGRENNINNLATTFTALKLNNAANL